MPHTVGFWKNANGVFTASIIFVSLSHFTLWRDFDAVVHPEISNVILCLETFLKEIVLRGLSEEAKLFCYTRLETPTAKCIQASMETS